VQTNNAIQISLATESDLPFIHNVYAHHVLHGTGTFEEITPTLDQIGARWKQRQALNQPTLVAYIESDFAGFAYAASHKERSAYRYTVEDSIFVTPEHIGNGVGTALLKELIRVCREREFRQMMAVIGDSNNTGSINLHKRCGFSTVGTATALGYKFGTWLDIVYMQYKLR